MISDNHFVLESRMNRFVFKLRPILRKILILFKYGIIVLGVFLILYFVWFREWQHTWGASNEDVARYMPGDELLDGPGFNTTRAVKIKAPPEKIWPWLSQMGYKRAGLYGFDKLDNAGIPSSEVILMEYQDLKVGDLIPLGPHNGLRVLKMNPNESMCWIFEKGPWHGATWSWGLYKIDGQHTKLVSRLRAKYHIEHPLDIIAVAFIDVFEILAMRKCLLGIKRRAEADAGQTEELRGTASNIMKGG